MSSLEIHVLDVGKADSTLIVDRDGAYTHSTLVDTATAEEASVVVDACRRWAGGIIDLMVLTHPDNDHIGGVEKVISSVFVKEVLADDPQIALDAFGPKLSGAGPAIRERLECVEKGAEVIRRLRSTRPVHTPHPGQTFGRHLIVLGPSDDFWASCMRGYVPPAVDLASLLGSPSADGLDVDDDASPINQSSIVLGIETVDGKFLLPADAGQAALLSVGRSYNIERLKWLRVPHHGSRHNISTHLIQRMRPEIAVVSAAAGDADHPHDSVIRALNAVGTRVLGTRGAQYSWWSDGMLRPGFVPARPIVAPPAITNEFLRALLLGASR